MKNKKASFVVQAGVIAALYTAITLGLAPISYGPVMQVRISEVLTVLPALTPAAIPGLFIGCALANILGPYGLADMIFGSAATLLAALLTYSLRKKPLLAPLPPVVSNAVIVGSMLVYLYEVPVALWAACSWIALGEFISCYLLGYPLLRYLIKHEERLGLGGHTK